MTRELASDDESGAVSGTCHVPRHVAAASLFVDQSIGFVDQNVTGLAFQNVTNGVEGRKPYGPRLTRLQNGKIRQSNSNFFGQLRE